MRDQFPNIVCTDHILWGSPRIDGRRLAVGDVIFFLKSYGTLEQVMKDFELTLPEIKQALQYCATLTCKFDNPTKFCHNCSLRREQEGSVDISEYRESDLGDSTIVESGNFVYLGSMQELLEEWEGKDWWKTAEDLVTELRDELNTL